VVGGHAQTLLASVSRVPADSEADLAYRLTPDLADEAKLLLATRTGMLT
jgi:hypothetical protein